MLELALFVLRALGYALILLGAFASLAAAAGFHRFKDFYLRLHATTVSAVWGCVYPLVGTSLVALSSGELGESKWIVAGASFVAAILIFILAPTGTHALARGVHRSRTAHVVPFVEDALDRDLCGEGYGSG